MASHSGLLRGIVRHSSTDGVSHEESFFISMTAKTHTHTQTQTETKAHIPDTCTSSSRHSDAAKHT
eukprot:m.256724 g.256724  ORF g.256724 m.256724 type:complete len:66 (-) comp22410_c0_seq1:160-357(-)